MNKVYCGKCTILGGNQHISLSYRRFHCYHSVYWCLLQLLLKYTKQPENKNILYIIINFSFFDTINFTECGPIFRITTLWVFKSISPSSKSNNVCTINYVYHLARFKCWFRKQKTLFNKKVIQLI